MKRLDVDRTYKALHEKVHRLFFRFPDMFCLKSRTVWGVLCFLSILCFMPHRLGAVDGPDCRFETAIGTVLSDIFFIDTSSVGEGLCEWECKTEVRYNVSEHFDFDLWAVVKDSTPYDTIICSLVPIKGKYPITRCDSVWHLLSRTIDSIPAGQKSVVRDGAFVVVDIYTYDTIDVYAFDVHCREVDTMYSYDTVISQHCVDIFDTLHSNDTLVLYGPDDYTDTTMTFHPHVYSTYRPFAEILRYKDSIQALINRLNALLADWPEGIREDMTLEDKLAAVIASMSLPAGAVADTAHIIDSLNAIVPVTPAYYRAWIAALQNALDTYSDTVEYTQEYHIDSVRVKVVVHLKNGAVAIDTFTIRTIPLLYERQPDTGIQFDHDVQLWAGSPDLPDGTGKYADITWYPPLDKYGNPVTTNKGFNPNALLPGSTVSLIDSVHIRTLLGQGGVNLFDSKGPFYIADTLDGDTLLFPIRVDATPELKALYPHAPDHLCSIYDTIRVAIIKGFKIDGFVSYASFWKPSLLADLRSADAPFDQDVTLGTSIPDQHRPVAKVTVQLFDLSGNLIDTTISDKDGYFSFGKRYMRGLYRITGKSPQKKSVYGNIGLNGNDATWVQNYVARVLDQTKLPEKTNPKYSMWWWASNVNLSKTPEVTLGLDGNDATAIQNKVAQILSNNNSYTDENTSNPIDDWVYSNDTLDLQEDTMFHVRGVMRGDADRNYNDVSSSGQMQKGGRFTKASLTNLGKISVYADERILDFPVLSIDEGYLSGFQLFLYFNPDKIEPVSVRMPSFLNPQTSNLAHNIVDDQILTTWISKDKPYFHTGDTILMLRFKVMGNLIKNVGSYFKNNLVQYVVSDTASRIVKWEVAMPQLRILTVEDTVNEDSFQWDPLIENGDTIYMPDANNEIGLISNSGDSHHSKRHNSHIISVIPNPIFTWGDVTYHVGESCLVNLKLYSLLGENVLTFVDGERQQGLYRISMNMQSLPSGIYILRLETIKEGKTEFDFVKVIVRR